MVQLTRLHSEIPSRAGWEAIGEPNADPSIFGTNNDGLLWNAFKTRFQNEDMDELKKSLGYLFSPDKKFNQKYGNNPELLLQWFPELAKTWERIEEDYNRVARNLVANNHRYEEPDLSFVINANQLSDEDFVLAMGWLNDNYKKLSVKAPAWLYAFKFAKSHPELGYKGSEVFDLAAMLTRAFSRGANIIHAQNFLKDEVSFMGEIKELAKHEIKLSQINLLFKTEFPISEFNDLKDMPKEWVYALNPLPRLKTSLR